MPRRGRCDPEKDQRRATGVSIRVMARVWEHSQSSGGQLLVLLAIADFADDHGKAWPSVSTLAKKARISERHTQKVIKQLKDMGELVADQRPSGHWGTNLYRITLNPEGVANCHQGGELEATGGVASDAKGGELEATLTVMNRHKNHRGRKTPSLKNSDSRIKEFFTWWNIEYQRRIGEPYVISGGKDGALIKNLLRTFDLPKLKTQALRFFDSKDSWVQERGGYTIGVFASQFNKLVSTSKANDNRPPRREMPA